MASILEIHNLNELHSFPIPVLPQTESENEQEKKKTDLNNFEIITDDVIRNETNQLKNS